MMSTFYSVCRGATIYPSVANIFKRIPATRCLLPLLQSHNSMVANGYHIQYGRSIIPNRSYSHDAVMQCVHKLDNGETIIRSPYKDVEHCNKTFGEFMFAHLDEFKDLELMVDFPTGRTYTGANIKESAIKLASALIKLGYKKGDVVLIIAPNCPEYVVVFLACGLLGVAVSTANPAYTSGELSRQIVHCEAKALFTHNMLLPTVLEALQCKEAKQAHNVKEIITLYGVADKCRPYESLLQDDGSSFTENVEIDPKQTVLTLPYSSGTTGLPKGVMLSHTNLVMNLIQGKCGQMRFRKGEEVLLGLVPFYHIYGMMVLKQILIQGAKLIIHPRFEPATFLQSIQDYKITYCHLVPPLVLFLAKDPSVAQYDISSVEKIMCGAAPLGKALTLDVERHLNITVTQAYGMTECSPLTHHDHFPPRHGTIGQLIPSTIAKIVDPETGRVVDVGETGEIVMKGPQVMMGYLNNKAATVRTIDSDGWIYSGDIGYIDSDGYFTICDRLKELIKYKGFQVAPAELEALLCSHPSIQDAAVVGLQAGEEVGEVPKAFVVKKPNTEITTEDILDYVKDNVASYKKLRGGVEFIEQVPKTPSGKILRRLLKK